MRLTAYHSRARPVDTRWLAHSLERSAGAATHSTQPGVPANLRPADVTCRVPEMPVNCVAAITT